MNNFRPKSKSCETLRLSKCSRFKLERDSSSEMPRKDKSNKRLITSKRNKNYEYRLYNELTF